MSWSKPPPSQVLEAIRLYLQVAYDGPPPSAVRLRAETLRSLPEEDFYDSPIFERSAQRPDRLAVRLGSRFYPHMKLAIERAAGQPGWAFMADTHESHCMPEPRSRDYHVVQEIRARNGELARRIETAWTAAGLPVVGAAGPGGVT